MNNTHEQNNLGMNEPEFSSSPDPKNLPYKYRGRFAPSPTGPLHLGSLTTALGSFLDARSRKGEWLLRIEDIDPPREHPGAKSLIPRQLEAHGLIWDGDISYQSERSTVYLEILDQLLEQGLAYPCICSRQQVKAMGQQYNRQCLNSPVNSEEEAALRLKIDQSFSWIDGVQGSTVFDPKACGGDFIVHRKDGLFSYQLAVAVDDHFQGITHVVRGADLLDSTARQGLIMAALDWQPPNYAHLPVIKGADGQKLSKQNHAPALDYKKAVQNLYSALQHLRQNPSPELALSNLAEILDWAVQHWQISKVSKTVLG